MKAISLWQPWASLWATRDAKVHETRSWPTKHRGELAIHASKTFIGPDDLPIAGDAEASLILGVSDFGKLPLGAIIAVISLQECAPTSVVRSTATKRDLLFGNFDSGRYAWRRGEIIHLLPQPVKCRGFQGVWNLAPELEAAVRAQLPVTGAP